MYEFKLPDLGEGVAEGEILKWYAGVGDTIEEDAPLVDIETDKAAVTIPSPKSGVIKSLAGDVGDTVEVGTVLVAIDADGGGASQDGDAKKEAPKEQKSKAQAKSTEPRPSAGASSTNASSDGQSRDGRGAAPRRAPAGAPANGGVTTAVASAPVGRRGDGRPVPAAPATRRMARELGIDINEVPGSGPGGRITADDVRLFAEGGVATAPSRVGGDDGAVATGAGAGIPYYDLDSMPDFERWGEVEREPVRSIRRKVARKMVTSMVTVPHVAHMDDADVTELEEYRRKVKATGAQAFTMMAVVMKALTICLREFPAFNASLDPHRNEIVYKKFYNVGFAADTPRGLLVPVVKNTDQLSVNGISARVRELAGAARDGKIDVEDMQGGTFTVTNVGAIGGTYVVPTINYPEVAILGMGRLTERAAFKDGVVVPRLVIPFCLTFDHRITDGADAARFMNRLVEMMSDPLELVMNV